MFPSAYGPTLLFLPVFFSLGKCYTVEELALFDLVEEVNENFYELFGVKQDSDTSEIKRSYRKLSLKWHPDRNAEEGAARRFQQIAAAYDVLKDDTMRARYNQVLEFGLPDWKQPIFYYRRLRKMPSWEIMLFVVAILTVGHYLVLWAIYFEHRLEMDDLVLSKIRRKEKKLKRAGYNVDKAIEAGYNLLPRPGWSDTLPCVTVRFLIDLPPTVRQCLRERQERLAIERELRRQEELEEEEMRKPPVEKYKSKPRTIEAPDANDAAQLDGPVIAQQSLPMAESLEEISTKTGFWTPEEVAELIRLSNKYPMGTPDRWERIARTLKRKTQEVTDMVGELKRLDPNEYHKLCTLSQSQEKESSTADVWTKSQQKCLEQSLVTFPKGTLERWEKIAETVPGKNKDQCMARFKAIAEAVKKRKGKAEKTQ